MEVFVATAFAAALPAHGGRELWGTVSSPAPPPVLNTGPHGYNIVTGIAQILYNTFHSDDSATCNEEEHHPLDGGYYTEGVAGINETGTVDDIGRLPQNSSWVNNSYYPHGENGQYLYAHTCAMLRFSYKANARTTVYELPSQQALDDCDFSGATLWGDTDAGEPYYNYYIEVDADLGYLYFASLDGCSTGMKVAVYVSDDYADNYDVCYRMGTDTSRIQHCDCDFSMNPSTLVDPCHTGFYQGCMDAMPDDLSCCPSEGSYYDENTREYVSDGTCVAKSSSELRREAWAEQLAQSA